MPRRFTIRRSGVIAAPIDAVYQVVADVERYPEFLPGVRAVRVRGALVDMTVDLGPLSLTWTQQATFEPPHAVSFVQVEGPFRFLRGSWTFREEDGRTHVAHQTEFELSLRLPGLDRVVERALADNVEKAIAAFHRRVS